MKFFNKIIIILIREFYQKLISPFLGGNCRFTPTCSEYCLGCFKEFSFFRALWYSIRRLFKCSPLFKGGDDPIPRRIHK